MSVSRHAAGAENNQSRLLRRYRKGRMQRARDSRRVVGSVRWQAKLAREGAGFRKGEALGKMARSGGVGRSSSAAQV